MSCISKAHTGPRLYNDIGLQSLQLDYCFEFLQFKFALGIEAACNKRSGLAQGLLASTLSLIATWYNDYSEVSRFLTSLPLKAWCWRSHRRWTIVDSNQHQDNKVSANDDNDAVIAKIHFRTQKLASLELQSCSSGNLQHCITAHTICLWQHKFHFGRSGPD